MHWAQGRQFLIWSIIIAVLIAIAAAVGFVVLYKVPSCTDNVQNQDERGIDCGGSCATVCTADAQAPQVVFVRTLEQVPGRTDIIAYVINRNATAETTASYTVELYDENNAVIATYPGKMKLPISVAPTPLFIPAAYMGTKTVTHAFLTFSDPITWKQGTGLSPKERLSSEYSIGESNGAPQIIASIHNPLPRPLSNLKVIIAVFDASDSVMAASQTVLRDVPPQGDTPAVFTWTKPFSSVPVKVDILPLYP